MAATGAWWLLVPEHYAAPSGDAGDSLVGLAEPALVSGALLVLGILGAVVTVVGTEGGRSAPERWVTAPTVALAVIFGFLVPDLGLLVGLGYTSALVAVPAALVLPFVLAVRRPRFRPVAGGLLVLLAAVAVVFGIDGPALVDILWAIGGEVPTFLATQAFPLAAFIGALIWVGVALEASGIDIAGARPGPWTPPARDGGWWITVAAVICPVFFAAQRLTWLTPWPYSMDVRELDANPGLRAFGLALGLAAICGAALTSGLIGRWGAVYPQWMPRVGGRAVSPVWPSVVAASIGALVTVAGRSLAQFTLLSDGGNSGAGLLVGMAVVFLLWGPLLMASAIAYFVRRTPSPARHLTGEHVPVARPAFSRSARRGSR